MLIKEIYYSFSVNNKTISCIVKWKLKRFNDVDFFLNNIKAIKSDIVSFIKNWLWERIATFVFNKDGDQNPNQDFLSLFLHTKIVITLEWSLIRISIQARNY